MLSACHIQCIYELIVPKGNMEKGRFSWKQNISLLCKFIHQYYTLTNLVPFMSMKGTYQLWGSSEVSVRHPWHISGLYWHFLFNIRQLSTNYWMTVNWLSNDYRGTINWYDHCHIDHYIDLTLPTIHMIQRTNLYKFVLKNRILSFFTSLIIYGCKNFSKLIHWEHINKSQTMQKVETECRKLKWCNNKS